MRAKAAELGVDPDRIGICGFSAGGRLAIDCSLRRPALPESDVRCTPDFAGLFYPGIPSDVAELLNGRVKTDAPVCPLFIINSRTDQVTPADRCVDFYVKLLKAKVDAELLVYGRGCHGFDLGRGRGESLALWPVCFVAWLKDSGIMADGPASK